MKRFLYCLFLIFIFLSIVGCNNPKDKKVVNNKSNSKEYKTDDLAPDEENKPEDNSLSIDNYITDQCPLMKNIIHRGLGTVAPECTEPAYRLAAQAGYKYAENDLWFTADGYPIMVHMQDVSVTSDGNGKVNELTLEYLKALDFGNKNKFGDKYKGTKILTFEEWIALCKELDISPYIDCKYFAASSYEGKHGVETCLSILDKYGMRERATWIVGLSGARSVLSYDPNARIAIICSTVEDTQNQEVYNFIASVSDKNNRDKIILNVASGVITEDLVKKYNAINANVEAWLADENAYNNHARIASLYRMRVTGFTNDGVNIGAALKKAGYSW